MSDERADASEPRRSSARRPRARAAQPEVVVSDVWLFEDGTVVPEGVKDRVRQELGQKITNIVLDGDFGRHLLGLINGLWDGEGKAPDDVQEIFEAGRNLAVRSSILHLNCDRELEEFDKLVRAAMARRKMTLPPKT